LGIETHILEATLLKDAVSPSRSNLESVARPARYRLLGQACRDYGARLLLLGHHQDDAVETTLMRIANGYRFNYGLNTSLPSNLPACEGIYGLHKSGAPLDFDSSSTTITQSMGVRGFEAPGIKVLRPMLTFPKQRLVETCRQNSLPWLEDASNSDKTLTSRNAIRSLIANDNASVLPVALRTPSLLAFATRAAATRQEYEDLAEKLVQECVIKFDPQCGVLYVKALTRTGLEAIVAKELSGDSAQCDMVAACLLKRLLEIISPAKYVRLSEVMPWVDLFVCQPPKPTSETFQCASTTIRRCQTSNTESPAEHSRGIFSSSVQAHTDWHWAIHRQPIHHNLRLHLHSLGMHENMRILRTVGTKQESPEYRLYDGRFWISVHNPTAKDVRIRPLLLHQLSILRSALTRGAILAEHYSQEEGWQAVKADALRGFGFLRLCGTTSEILLASSLPILESYDLCYDSKDGWQQVLALPTLGLRFVQAVTSRQPSSLAVANWLSNDDVRRIRWDVRYKQVTSASGCNPLLHSLMPHEPLSRWEWNHALSRRP
jgi:tRNA(Ile)-lysidine synthase